MTVDVRSLVPGVRDFADAADVIVVRLRDEIDLVPWSLHQVTDYVQVLGRKILMYEQIVHTMRFFVRLDALGWASPSPTPSR